MVTSIGRRTSGFACGCCVLILAANALGQATLYTVPAEYTVTQCDEIIEFEVWTNPNGNFVRAWQVWFDCFGPAGTDDAPCTTSRTVDYVLTPKPCAEWSDCCPYPGCDTCTDGFCDTTLAGPIVDDTRPDYIYFGFLYQVPTENMGDCPATPDPPYDPFIDGPRASNALLEQWEYPTFLDPVYLCTWHFQASHDASGDFVLDWYCDANDGCAGDRTALLGADNMPITPLISTPLIVHVPCGQCCDETVCLGEMTQCQCDDLGGTWTEGKTCADECLVLGSCCYRNAGVCLDGMTEADCMGEWFRHGHCADLYPPCEIVGVPTVSEWGLIALTLLMLMGILVKFGRRRAASSPG